MIIGADRKEQECRVWQQYLTVYPKMEDEEHFTSYEDFKEKAFRQPQPQETVEEILKRTEQIKNADKLRKEVNN